MRKILVLFVGILLGASPAICAGDLFFDGLKAGSFLEIPYNSQIPDLGGGIHFLMDPVESLFLIQDLGTGKLLLVDPEKGTPVKSLSFPRDLLSIRVASDREFLLLFRDGVSRITGLKVLIAMLEMEKPRWKKVTFEGKKLDGAREVYRLKSGKDGMLFVRDIPSRTLYAFEGDGSFVRSFVCDQDFLPTRPRMFLTSHYDPGRGMICQEKLVEPKSAPKVQREVEGIRQEIGMTRQDVVPISFDESTGRVILAVDPPIEASEDPVDQEPAPGIQQQVTDLEKADSEAGQENILPVNRIFHDSKDPNSLFSVVFSLESDGRLIPIAKFPFSDTEGKIKPAKEALFFLAMKIRDGVALEKLEILRKDLSK